MSNILSPIVDGLWTYGRWFLSAWIDIEEDKEVIKNNYDKLSEIKEFEGMKKEIKEHENKIKSLEMPTMLPYEYIWTNREGNIRVCIGKDVNNEYVWVDFSKCYHLMIAGLSGAGKTSLVRSMLISLRLAFTPSELMVILVDPKGTELYLYEEIDNVLGKEGCIVEEEKFNDTLDWLMKECKRRSKLLKEYKCKDVRSYNLTHEDKFNHIIIVIDEVVQIAMNTETRKKLHKVICFVRAFSVSFVVCSQEASKDTIGKIKINMGHTIGLRTHDKVDSDVIMKGGNLQDIKSDQQGRCKYHNGVKIVECQSFYSDEKDIEEYLGKFRKV